MTSIDPLEPDTYAFRVMDSTPVTPVIRELRLVPVADAMPFRAGQFALLGDAAGAIPQRSYSIANAPRDDGLLSLLITRVDGGPTSTWAHTLTTHDEVRLEGPYGTFVSDPGRTSPVLLLAAGSGLAPIRALTESLLDDPPPDGAAGRRVTLMFSGRTEADAIDRARFVAWAAGNPRLTYLLTCTRNAAAPRHRRIPDSLADDVRSLGRGLSSRGEDRNALAGVEVFAAGPPAFVRACAAAAADLGAAPVDIHREEFFPG